MKLSILFFIAHQIYINFRTICIIFRLQHWNQLSRLQRNIIIVVISGLCIILLLWIPSAQPNSEINDNDDTPSNHIQITPIKDHHSIESQHNQQKRKTDEDDEPQHQLIADGKVKRSESEDSAANSVIDNVENVRNGAEENVHTDYFKAFNGPQNERQRAVVTAARHAWTGYKKYAWGHDNLKPITKSSHDWFGLGLTIVDSLDTLYIMSMDEEFEEARNWIETNLKLDADRDVNLFEVTIRVLGGLLGAYHLSGDRMFLTKAVSLSIHNTHNE